MSDDKLALTWHCATCNHEATLETPVTYDRGR